MVLPLRGLVFLVLLLSPFGAMARELPVPELTTQKADNSPKVGGGVICDTAQQVARYLTLHSQGKSPDVALRSVNTEAQNPTACGLSLIAFVENEEVETLPATGGIMRLMKITVLAAKNNEQWQRIPPTVQYTALFEKAVEI